MAKKRKQRASPRDSTPKDNEPQAPAAVVDHRQAKKKTRKKRNPATKKPVRTDWSPAAHSLGALFSSHPELGKKVVVVDPHKPHLIDLLEPPQR